MQCPNDHQPLKLIAKGNTIGHRCLDCDGVFLHGTAVQAFVYNYESDILLKLTPVMETNSPIKTCPGCQHPMRWQTAETIELDVCQNCGGIWFDPKGLEEVITHHGQTNSDKGITLLDYLATFIPFGGGGGSC